MSQPGSVRADIGRDPLVSPATREHRVCLVWRGDPAPRDPPVLLVPQVTPSLSLLPLSRVVRPSRVFPGLQVPWELQDLRASEEPMEREVQAEEEECQECLVHLGLLAGKDYQGDPATLESLASLADR